MLDYYLKLNRRRKEFAPSGRGGAPLFKPHTNYRTLPLDKPLSSRMVQETVNP